MKKLLALVLALVMMFAVCVPVFAVVETKNNVTTVKDNNTQKEAVPAKIHTNTELPAGEYAYILEIPADTEIKWDNKDSHTRFEYRIISTQLNAGQRLRVNVMSEDGVSELTSEASTAKIPYTFTRYNADADEYTPVANLNYTTDREVITTARPRTFYISIAAASWNVPLAEYTDILNFQIDIIDAEGNVVPAPAA